MGRIRDLMTVLPRTVKPGDSIVDAAKLMRGEDAGIAPIVEGDRLVGVVTDRDIAIRVVATGRDPQETKVEEIASLTLVTIDPDAGPRRSVAPDGRTQVRRLPVVEEDGRLVGIVAQADVARHASNGRTGDSRRADFAVKSGFSCACPLARGCARVVHWRSRRVRRASRSKLHRAVVKGASPESAGR